MPTSELRAALKELGACAKRIAEVAPATPSPKHLELQIGVGTASDWIAWASRLRSLDFSTSIKRGSPRAKSYLESTRFTYAWTAANALFARDNVVGHLATGKLPPNELGRFRLLMNAAQLTQTELKALSDPMQKTLGLVRKPDHFVWVPATTVRVIDLIHHKYTPDAYKGKGAAGKSIEAVVTGTKPISTLDLPVLLYATRNWTLHGSLLDSSFRGAPQQYQQYVTTATKAIATILGKYAAKLRAKL